MKCCQTYCFLFFNNLHRLIHRHTEGQADASVTCKTFVLWVYKTGFCLFLCMFWNHFSSRVSQMEDKYKILYLCVFNVSCIYFEMRVKILFHSSKISKASRSKYSQQETHPGRIFHLSFP